MVMVCWWTGRGLEDTGVGMGVAVAAAPAADLVGSGIDGLGPLGVVGAVEWMD